MLPGNEKTESYRPIEWWLFLLVSVLTAVLVVVYTISIWHRDQQPMIQANLNMPFIEQASKNISPTSIIPPTTATNPNLLTQVLHNNHATTPILPPLNITIKNGDSLNSIFQKLQISTQDYYAITKNNIVRKNLKLRPGQILQLSIDNTHRLQQFTLDIDTMQFLQATRANERWDVSIQQKPLHTQVKSASGTVFSSFAQAGKQAGLSPRIIAQLENIFSQKIDFARQLYPGDRFKVLYQEYRTPDDKTVKKTEILAAQLINHTESYWAIRYAVPSGKPDYYSLEGKSVSTSFLRAPVHYKYISSPFNARRMHPILHIIRPHEGVDLAAPAGTPIYAASDGRIVFRGRKGGYGKVIIIRHNGTYTTLYAHMSNFAKSLHVNSWVKEGMLIGYVGETGFATGPHLHYEFHINGIPRDPMTVHLPSSQSIPSKEKTAFLAFTGQMVKQLNQVV